MSMLGFNRHKSRIIKSLPYLLLAIAPLCWASNAVLARGVVHIIPPVSLAFWRWTIASLLLWPFAHQHAKRDWPLLIRHCKTLFFLSFTFATSTLEMGLNLPVRQVILYDMQGFNGTDFKPLPLTQRSFKQRCRPL